MDKDFDNPWGLTTPKGVVKKMSQILNSSVFPGVQGGPLEHCIAAKAVSFYEALLLSYLYFMISESVEHYQVRSLGYGLDGTLWSFYQKDLENGISKAEIATYIAYFLMQFSAMGNYWGQPMYLGGEGKINELTYLILDIYDSLGIYNPKIQLKVNPNSPKDYVCKALDMVRHGAGNMVFCNEDTITKALMRQGATYEQALDSVIKGCYEYTTKADTICISFSRSPPAGV